MTTEIKENTQEKALAPFRELREILAPYPSDRYMHLLPTSYQEQSDLYRPAVTVVKLNPDDQRDVYDTPGSGGKTVCLHSQALERIANAAGIDFDPTLTKHFHDRVNQPFVCEIHVGGWYTDSLGQRRPITAGAVSDLRDGTPTAKVLRGGLETARQFICERTESRARNRAIRKTTNLPSSFARDELRKPMVAVRFRLDERDPEARRALIVQATRATSQVFGSDLPALDAGVATPDEEIIEGQLSERGESSDDVQGRVIAPRSPEERGGTTAEVAGSSPAPRSEPDPVEEDDVPVVTGERAAAIRAHVEQLRRDLRWGNDARDARPTDRQVGLVATTIAKALAGEPKRLSAEQQKALRRAVLEALFGPFAAYDELSSDRVSVAIDWSKAFPGEVRDLVAFVGQTDAAVAALLVALRGQQELGGGR